MMNAMAAYDSFPTSRLSTAAVCGEDTKVVELANVLKTPKQSSAAQMMIKEDFFRPEIWYTIAV